MATSTFSLARAADAHPNALAIVGASGELTYRAWANTVKPWFARLEGARLIALEARTNFESLAVVYACLELGIAILPLHPRWSPQQRDDALKAAAPDRWFDGSELHHLENGPQIDANIQVVIATSGTTGPSKLVLLSVDALRESAVRSQQVVPLGPGDSWALSLPYAHIGGFSIITRCLLAGAAVSIPASTSTLSPDVTHASLVPTQLKRLMEQARTSDKWQHLLIGGAPLPTAVHQRALQEDLPIHITYGLTEFCSQVATSELRPAVDAPIPALNGIEFKRSKSGNLCVRGPTMMRGYLGHPKPGEWFETSDRASLHGNSVKVVGRSDYVILSGGENVSPEQVEAALTGLVGIESAAVCGVPDEQWGQRVVALVVQQGVYPTLEAIPAMLKEDLPTYAIPKELYRVKELPLLANGKLSRSQLSEQFALARGAREP